MRSIGKFWHVLPRRGDSSGLQRIGCVVHISSNGNMVLKADNVPRIGDQAVDENLKAVGMVFDVFGPIANPYVAVRPSVEEPSHYVQHVLYAANAPSKQRMGKRRRR
jgi:RNA-binding protein